MLRAAVARRADVSAPLALVVAGLAAGLIPGVPDIQLDPDLVRYVALPPLLWSGAQESSYVGLGVVVGGARRGDRLRAVAAA